MIFGDFLCIWCTNTRDEVTWGFAFLPRLVSLVLGYLVGALQYATECCSAIAAAVSLLGGLARLVDSSLVV